ncbi:MAG: RadC-like DNA repair protein [Bacteroidetes bacterium HLUCCA01]|nr:MAG: RadC-like DNA repair protein [Bacteroidetes bacterium HLUCCA01]
MVTNLNQSKITMVKHFSEIKMTYRTDKRYKDLPTIREPEEAARLLRRLWDKGTLELREEFMILILNAAKLCTGWCKMSTGGQTATIVDPAGVFRVALQTNAHSIIIAHNHPSNNCTASHADIQLTKRIHEAGRVLGVQLEDHIILCPDGSYVSLRSKGLF